MAGTSDQEYRKSRYNGNRLIRAYVDESVKAKFKAVCALQQRGMSEVLSELIQKWIEENKNLLQGQ